MNGQVTAFPMPDPMRPNGSARYHPGLQEQSAFAPSKTDQWRSILAQLRARATGPAQPPAQQPVSPPPGTTTTVPAQPTPQRTLPPWDPSWTPYNGNRIVGGMVGQPGMVTAHGGPQPASQPGGGLAGAWGSRILGVPRGSVRSQLSRGPRPGRSTAFHDYTGSSVGSESGHYARVKGFTS